MTQKKQLSKAQSNLAKLPDACFATLNTTEELIQIRAGEKGYYRLGQAFPKRLCQEQGGITMDQLADRWNIEKGITKAQREAMEVGSMWGWEVPGANPDFYENLIK